MSKINDDLKRVRQAPPSTILPQPVPPSPREPFADKPNVLFGWILPIFIIILIFVAIFFIGLALAHNRVHQEIAEQNAVTVTQQVLYVPPVVVTNAPVLPTPEPVVAPRLPRLQGIFYSPTAPTAILDGKTVSPGDEFEIYHVKEIGKYTVTLVDTNNKEIKLGMGS